MWNKIFKSKSSKPLAKKDSKVFATSAKTSSRSKLAKVVNSFTLKRSSKQISAKNVPAVTVELPTNDDFDAVSKVATSRTDPISTRSGNNNANENDVEEPDPVKLQLQPCPICTRTFVPATLAKHVKICEKMATKKRKQFDSSRQRREGTDLADFLPKNFGLPPTKQEPKTSPKPVQSAPVHVVKKVEESPKQPTANILKKNVPVSQPTPPKEKVKLCPKVPPTLQCPHCERGFGAKAYDRHVEWCKEKQRIANIQNNSSLNAAKERLNARTKYKAPCLKTKRAANREKYSGLSREESTNSLSDGGGGCRIGNNGNGDKMSMSTSLTSSIMSDGGLSDKYDPFLSAKRQLEELCSPTQISAPRVSPIAPSTKPKLMSSISISPSNPSTVRSNFRRTCSLRAPRKTPPTRPLFIPPTLHRPTIQRGISDEGPISHSFLKPEEYDEMPVKSVCVNDFAASHSPKVIKRDPNTNLTRRNLRLNLNKTNDKSNPLSKTDSLAIFLKYESEAKKIESPADFTEKDLKDKSNTLSKQTSQKVVSNTVEQSSGGDKENVPTLKDSLANLLESKSCYDYSKSRESSNNKPLISNKMYPIKLEPLPKLPSLLSCNSSVPPANVNLSSILDTKDNDFIDPKLINICDNLPMNITKLSDSDLTSSSTDSASTTKFLAESQQLQQYQQQTHRQAQYQQSNPNRNSTERKNLLKRQMRFGKNQFLYDMSPESDPYSEECDKTISLIESRNKMLDSPSNEPSFDDFDFEEFLSSFENDEEQFPIFKDCKEFLMNRTFNKKINNYSECSNRSPSHPNSDFENDRNKSEIFISIETSQNGSTPSPTNPSTHGVLEDIDGDNNKIENFNTHEPLVHDEKHDIFDDFTDVNRNNARNIMKQFEQDFSTNEQNIAQMTGSGTTTYPVDSDDISSVECFPLRRSTKSKQSADSAYGSLSRHSPTEQRSARRNLSRSRQHSAASIPEQQSLLLKYHAISDSKPRNRDASISSSGSETSLPPIQAQKAKDQQLKKELKMFKYCHECGSEFPITHAKFCMECGVRRIVLE